jgi:hypothetical protein
MERVSIEYLLSKGFEKHGDNFGWAKIRKNGFELVEIPLKKGGFIIGFEYQYCLQTKYKYPIKINELEQLYKLLTGSVL